MDAAGLARKLKLTPTSRAALVGPPDGYRAVLEAAGQRFLETTDGDADWVQLFAADQAALQARLPAALAALAPDGRLWISYPKGSSKIQTDLTRDKGWDVVEAADLMWLSLISIDETWSAFAVRRYRAGDARQTFR